MTKIWTVYGLIDPRDRSVFYVGMSTVVDRRIAQHSQDPASSAYQVCRIILSEGLEIGTCVFGSFTDKLAAKIMEGRLALVLPYAVNKKTKFGLPSCNLYPDWQDLRN